MLFPPARQFFSSLIDGCLKYKHKEKPKTGPRPGPRLNYDVKIGPIEARCCAEFCTLPDYAPPSIGRFRRRCGGGVRIREVVRIRQSGSDFNEGVHNLAGVQNSAQHLLGPG